MSASSLIGNKVTIIPVCEPSQEQKPAGTCSAEEIAAKRRLALDRRAQKIQEAAKARGKLRLQQYGLAVAKEMDETSNMTFIENLPQREYLRNESMSAEQLEVLDAVRERRNVFFSGPAGVGKSFILKEICKYLQTVNRHFFVTAPTGCASVNIHGKTINSWAHIGKGEDGWLQYIEDAKKNASNSPWRKAAVLIIDEISMVAASMLEKLDRIAREVRHDSRPFGGIQTIFCGDFFQLAPIDKSSTCWRCSHDNLIPSAGPAPEYAPPLYEVPLWQRCADHECGHLHNRNATYCFETTTWQELNFKTVMLSKVFRQTDENFVQCLNRLRFGYCNEQDEVLLRSCVRPLGLVSSQFGEQDIKPTNLHATRGSVKQVNDAELRKLAKQEMHTFHTYDQLVGPRTVVADYKKLRDCQAQEIIKLCVGCQVMLLHNAEKDLVNGSRGVIIDFVDSDSFLKQADQMDTRKEQSFKDSLIQWVSANGHIDKSENSKLMLPNVLFSTPRGPKSLVVLPHTWDMAIDQRNSARRTQIPLTLAWGMYPRV